MAFTKARENNSMKYEMPEIIHGFAPETSPENQPVLYDVWEITVGYFGLTMVEYYKVGVTAT